MGLLYGIRFGRRKCVVLTALGFPACLTGKHMDMPANMGFCSLTDVLPGWCLLPSTLALMLHQPGLRWQRRMVCGGIPVLMTQDLRKPRLVLSLKPVLGCVLKTTKNQVPAPAGAPAWKCLPEAKGLGKGTAVDKRAMCRVIIFPGKAWTVGNGKKGNVSMRKREKHGLMRSWNQLRFFF